MNKIIPKVILHLISKHKILFFLICFIQIISIFACLFVYSFLVSANYFEKEYSYSKTFTVSLEENCPTSKLLNYISEFQGECKLSLSSLSVIDQDLSISFDFIYNPEHTLYGRYFTQEEFETNKDVIILSKAILPGIVDGESITINNENYLVVGTNYEINHIFPKSAIQTVDHTNDEVSITLSKYPNDSEYNSLVKIISTCFKNSTIHLPQRAEGKNNLMNNSSTMILICLLLISMINIAFVYRYIIECNKKLLCIFRLVGSTRKQCITIFLLVIIFIGSISFLLGCILSWLTLPSIISFVNFDNFIYALEIRHYIQIFLLFLFIILIAITPFIQSCIKKVNVDSYNIRR